MYYFLDIEEQIKRILNKISFKDLSRDKISSSAEILEDICDGTYYKSLLESEDGELLKKKEALTFLINTDGASICKKSGLTIWPVYLTINEIRDKFAIKNVILAGKFNKALSLFLTNSRLKLNLLFIGLSVGDSKPNFDSFLHPIVVQLKKLEYGIDVPFDDITKEIKFFLTHAVMDKPAKSALLNMISSTGFYGCTKCLQPGKFLRKNLNRKINMD
jgi:hypothetical protein